MVFFQNPNQRRYLNSILSYRFLIPYGLSLLSLTLLTIGVKGYREILHYQQVTLWYENLNIDTPQRRAFTALINEAQETLNNHYEQEFKNPLFLPEDIVTRIFTGNSQYLPSSFKLFPWTIKKNEERVRVSYGHTAIGDFDVNKQGNLQKRQKDRQKFSQNKIVQIFTSLFVGNFQEKLEQNATDNGVENLRHYTEILFRYLKINPTLIQQIPNLRINNVYIFHEQSGFMVTYPATQKPYKPGINFEERPWYRSSKGWYDTSFKKPSEKSSSGLTGIYIDINDENKPNAMRTLWYSFTDDNGDRYIWCFDFFIDQSNTFLEKSSWLSLLTSIHLWEWSLLPILSLPTAVILFFFSDHALKRFFGKIGSIEELPKIRMMLHDRKFPSVDGQKLKFVVKGNTTDGTYAEQFAKLGWALTKAVPNLHAGVSLNSGQRQQNQVSTEYEFTREYDLSMAESRPPYRCIEVWKVLLERHFLESQEIGFFVVKWNTSTNSDEGESLEIDHPFWENTYKQYLVSFKNQLEHSVLTTDNKEFVPIIDTKTPTSRSLPEVFQNLNSLQPIIKSSKYLKQCKLFYPSVKTLMELYKQGEVKAICSLRFLRHLKESKKLAEFFDVPVVSRHLIEYYPQEFLDFYNSLAPDLQKILKSQSSFKIMVYKDNITNLFLEQDDFCFISVDGSLRFVVKTFTDNSHEDFLGWISWREVDLKFYHLLYDCQIAQDHVVSSVDAYLKSAHFFGSSLERLERSGRNGEAENSFS